MKHDYYYLYGFRIWRPTGQSSCRKSRMRMPSIRSAFFRKTFVQSRRRGEDGFAGATSVLLSMRRCKPANSPLAYTLLVSPRETAKRRLPPLAMLTTTHAASGSQNLASKHRQFLGLARTRSTPSSSLSGCPRNRPSALPTMCSRSEHPPSPSHF